TVLDDKYGGKLGFAEWSNANMLVVAQIEDKKAWDNLDDILAVTGLTGVTGGPHDFAQSMGHPGEPNHPDRIAATLDVETRARAAGKTAGGDQTSGIGIAELMLGEARAFVAAHKNDKLGS
ncbi:MAG: hypothetical protein HON31_09955, partial [Chloroflexi bacterium]|nr:hypothetical protein [Chloroflexota bacterium]